MRLQEGETILHEAKPDSAILWLWLFTKCLPFTFVGLFVSFVASVFIGMAFVFALQLEGDFLLYAFVIAVSIIPLVLLTSALIYCKYLRRTYAYYITNQRCVFHGGILRRVERSVPYHKVTDVEMSQNIIERIAGISSLRIFTPGTASQPSPFGVRAEISFVGLKDNETPAAVINNILRKFRATGE